MEETGEDMLKTTLWCMLKEQDYWRERDHRDDVAILKADLVYWNLI